MATYDPDTKIWTNPPVQSLFNGSGNVGQAILFVQDLCPDAICQISADTGAAVTNRQMRQRTISLAQNLHNAGYRMGDVFAIASKNSEHVAPVVFASLLLGAPLSCLDPGFIKMDYIHILKQTRPKIIFCDPENIDVLKECDEELQLTASFVSFMHKVDGARFIEEYFLGFETQLTFESPKVDGADLISGIVCSSGTTGLSKPIALPHSCHLSFPRRKLFPFEEVFLNFSSLYWLSGYGFLINLTLMGAKRIITSEPYSPAVAIRIIEEYKVNHFASSPTKSMELLQSDEVKKADMSCIRLILSMGSILTPELRRKMVQVFKNAMIVNFYGSTETCGGVASGFPDDRLGFVGKIGPGVEAKVVNDQGEVVPNGEKGELFIRRPKTSTFLGYYNNSEATSEVLDNERWVHMGDLAYFNDQGDLFIVERIKSVMLYRNYWVSPSELEAFIGTLDGVAQVCVGPIADPVAVDLPAALVVKLPGATVTEASIIQAVKSTFAEHKHLHGGVYFIDEIPVTPSGKIRRNVVKVMLNELHAKRH